jgi:hypothetical protein
MLGHDVMHLNCMSTKRVSKPATRPQSGYRYL